MLDRGGWICTIGFLVFLVSGVFSIGEILNKQVEDIVLSITAIGAVLGIAGYFIHKSEVSKS